MARLFERVSAQLRRDISNGALRPGDKLPSERDLAEQMGVGRPVVREALRSLEEAGILEFRRGNSGGAFIGTGDTSIVARSISDLLYLGAISLDELMETRASLFRFATELAADRATEDDLARLERSIQETEAAWVEAGMQERVRLVIAFYEYLGMATHNEVLVMLIRSLSEVVAQILLKTQPEAYEVMIESRRRLVQWLRLRDRQAAAAEITVSLTRLHSRIKERQDYFFTLSLEGESSRIGKA